MRQSWKPSVEIACSMALRENLCGGASREPSVPVSPQGAYLDGSLLPASSPANACRSSLAWEVNMKRRMAMTFVFKQVAAPMKIGSEPRKSPLSHRASSTHGASSPALAQSLGLFPDPHQLEEPDREQGS